MAQVMGAELDSNGSAATATSSARLPLPPGETEATLFAKLVQLLGQQPGGTMLLTDLLGYLPFDPQQPEAADVTRAARMWLLGFQSIFTLTGSGDRECVTLKIKNNTAPAQAPGVPAATPPTDRWSAQPVDFQEQAIVSAGATEPFSEASGSRGVVLQTAVQLRGLPYKAQLRDIEVFLGHLAAEVQDGGINFLYTKSNQPSGYALVKFRSAEAAEKACKDLHKTYMSVAGGDPALAQTRYIEVFPATEKIDKGRNKAMLMMVAEDSRTAGQQGLSSRQLSASSSSTLKVADSSRLSQEQIHQDRLMKELRLHMAGIEGGQLLLSMLGVALSPESRSFLKKTNRGLKHFLAQYPLEFRIEGPKGQEKIIYVPTFDMERHQQAFEQEQMAMRSQCTPFQMFSQHEFGAYPPPISAFPPLDAPTLELHRQLMCDPSFLTADDPLVPPTVPMKRDFVPPASPPPPPSSAQLRAPCTPQDQRELPPIGTRTPSLWGDTPYPSPDRVRLSAHHLNGDNLSATTRPPPHLPEPPARDELVPSFDFPGSEFVHGLPLMERWLEQPPGMSPAGDDGYSMLMNMGLPGAFPYPGAYAAPPFPIGDHIPPSGGYDEIFAKKPYNEDPSSNKLCSQEAVSCRPTMHGTEQTPCLLIKGLPLNVTTQDIFSFFSKHQVIEGTADGEGTVHIGGGKKSPTSQAIVEMKSMEDALEAQQALDGQQLMEAIVQVSIHADSSYGKAPLPRGQLAQTGEEKPDGVGVL
mmetsp:Transcript_35373/g.64759  ORF Transcript_35373/g.64759 Transcript_35373/m.64759 type:complete len:751 (+) Transcript_35373:74-2326(+)